MALSALTDSASLGELAKRTTLPDASFTAVDLPPSAEPASNGVSLRQTAGRARRLIWNEVEAIEGDAEDGDCLVELADLRNGAR